MYFKYFLEILWRIFSKNVGLIYLKPFYKIRYTLVLIFSHISICKWCLFLFIFWLHRRQCRCLEGANSISTPCIFLIWQILKSDKIMDFLMNLWLWAVNNIHMAGVINRFRDCSFFFALEFWKVETRKILPNVNKKSKTNSKFFIFKKKCILT